MKYMYSSTMFGLVLLGRAAFVEMLLEARCIPTEDTYALLIRAFCTSGLIEKVEAISAEMRKNRLLPSAVVYNACINGLTKGRNPKKVVEIFQRMKRDRCQPSTETYTMLKNIHGKAREGLCEKAEEMFEQLQEADHEPDVYAYNALMEYYVYCNV